MGGLVVDQLAGVWRGPVLVPVDRQSPRASYRYSWHWVNDLSHAVSVIMPTCTKLLLLSTAQFLVLVVDIEIPGELLVILDPVARLLALLAVPGVALHSAVDDVDGGTKTRTDSIRTILRVTSDVKCFCL